MKLLSFGDKLEQGEYIVHSRFSKVTNFISGSHFVFVVNSSIGGGPFNIVVDGGISENWHSLIVDKDYCLLSGQKIVFDPALRYSSTLVPEQFDKAKFIKNLEYFSSTIKEYSSEKSLAFLLDDRRKINFKSSFERSFVENFESASNEFNSGDPVNAASSIKGLGFGLTPSGDDFNCGFLIALSFLQTQWHADNSVLKTKIYEAAIGNNLFTNVFLEAAKNGFLFENFRNVILSLMHSGQNEIVTATRSLLAHGETSGADESVGFLSGLRRFIK